MSKRCSGRGSGEGNRGRWWWFGGLGACLRGEGLWTLVDNGKGNTEREEEIEQGAAKSENNRLRNKDQSIDDRWRIFGKLVSFVVMSMVVEEQRKMTALSLSTRGKPLQRTILLVLPETQQLLAHASHAPINFRNNSGTVLQSLSPLNVSSLFSRFMIFSVILRLSST